MPAKVKGVYHREHRGSQGKAERRRPREIPRPAGESAGLRDDATVLGAGFLEFVTFTI
jgi:hypothetical protein